MKYTNEQRAEAIETLNLLVPEGSTVFCVLRHTSRSGMYRAISLYTFSTVTGEPEPLSLSYNAAVALRMKYDEKHGGVGVKGFGQDHGHAIVYELSMLLYGRSDALKHRWLG